LGTADHESLAESCGGFPDSFGFLRRTHQSNHSNSFLRGGHRGLYWAQLNAGTNTDLPAKTTLYLGDGEPYILGAVHLSFGDGYASLSARWSHKYHTLFGRLDRSVSILVPTAPVPAEIRSSGHLCGHVPGDPADAHQGADGILHTDHCLRPGFLHTTFKGKTVGLLDTSYNYSFYF